MNNLLSLLKIQFAKSFSKSAFSSKKSLSYFAIMAIIGAIGISMSLLYTFIYGSMYKEAGLSLRPIIYLFASAASLVTFFSGITQTQGIYLGSDYDLLASLPIRRRVVVASKIINLYIVEFLFSAIILIPNGVLLAIMDKDISLFLIDLLLCFFISALPLVISLFFSFVSSFVSSKFKYPNIIRTIIYVLLFSGIMLLSLSTTNGDVSSQVLAFNNVVNIVKWFNPSITLVELALNNNLLYLLLFVGVNVLLLGGITLFLALSYNKMHELVSSFKTNNKYKRKELKIKGSFKNQLLFEYKRLLNSKAYFLNGAMGLIAGIAIMAIMAFSVINSLKGNAEVWGSIKPFLPLASIVVVYGISMTSLTASGISIEGKNFWLLKTLPIQKKTILNAKLVMALSFYFVASLISSTILVISLEPDLYSILIIYLIPLAASFFFACYGLTINLIFYNLKWENEQQVTKNSKSVTITVLSSMVVEIVLGLSMYLLTRYVNVYIGTLLILALLLVVGFALYHYIMNKGTKKLAEIEDF